ncbi:hypothetical protein BDR22DRAFT_893157 [Usnea florida]
MVLQIESETFAGSNAQSYAAPAFAGGSLEHNNQIDWTGNGGDGDGAGCEWVGMGDAALGGVGESSEAIVGMGDAYGRNPGLRPDLGEMYPDGDNTLYGLRNQYVDDSLYGLGNPQVDALHDDSDVGVGGWHGNGGDTWHGGVVPGGLGYGGCSNTITTTNTAAAAAAVTATPPGRAVDDRYMTGVEWEPAWERWGGSTDGAAGLHFETMMDGDGGGAMDDDIIMTNPPLLASSWAQQPQLERNCAGTTSPAATTTTTLFFPPPASASTTPPSPVFTTPPSPATTTARPDPDPHAILAIDPFNWTPSQTFFALTSPLSLNLALFLLPPAGDATRALLLASNVNGAQLLTLMGDTFLRYFGLGEAEEAERVALEGVVSRLRAMSPRFLAWYVAGGDGGLEEGVEEVEKLVKGMGGQALSKTKVFVFLAGGCLRADRVEGGWEIMVERRGWGQD